jgi:hypothetical protein
MYGLSYIHRRIWLHINSSSLEGGATMNTKTASNPKSLETYIVIMGGGGAGLAAAVAAGENEAEQVAGK